MTATKFPEPQRARLSVRQARADRAGEVVAAPSAPVPTMSLRQKRVGAALVMQQAWQHADGLEWRDLAVVPEAAPNWEPVNAKDTASR